MVIKNLMDTLSLTNYMKLQTLDRMSIFIAELIGTGMLCFFGCMATVQWGNEPASLLQVIMGFAMSIMAIIQMFGHISGAHLNPAVTLSAFIQGLIDFAIVPYYLIAQFVGAYLGFGLLKLLTPAKIFRRPEITGPGCCSTVVQTDMTPWQGLAIEFIATSVIILTFCAIVDPRNKANTDSISLRFGFVIFAVALTTAPYTGASLNPARTLGPAIWNNDWENHWIYWAGPLGAGVLATLFYKALFWRSGGAPTLVDDEDRSLNKDKSQA